MVVHSVKWSNSRDSRDSRESGQRKVVHSSCQVNFKLSSINLHFYNIDILILSLCFTFICVMNKF